MVDQSWNSTINFDNMIKISKSIAFLCLPYLNKYHSIKQTTFKREDKRKEYLQRQWFASGVVRFVRWVYPTCFQLAWWVYYNHFSSVYHRTICWHPTRIRNLSGRNSSTSKPTLTAVSTTFCYSSLLPCTITATWLKVETTDQLNTVLIFYQTWQIVRAVQA